MDPAAGLDGAGADTQPGSNVALASAGVLNATTTAGAPAAPVSADGAAEGTAYVVDDDDDDEEGMIVHAGFGAPQKPVATSAVGGPVFLGLDGEEDAADAEATEVASAGKPAQS